MPQAIPLIIQAVGQAYGWSQVVVAIATVASTAAVGLYERDRAKQKARDAYNKSLQDRTVPVRSGIAGRSYVLGTVRKSGAVMYIEPVGPNKASLDVVLAMANNECELGGWYLNEDFISLANFPGEKYGAIKHKNTTAKETVTGPTASVVLSSVPDQSVNPVKVTYRKPGAKGVATIDSIVGATVNISGLPAGSVEVSITFDESLEDPLKATFIPGTIPNPTISWGTSFDAPGWTANHRIDGAACTRTLFTWQKDGDNFESGAPAVGAILTGRARAGYPFFDPRTSTNPTTTSNPALLAGWWMTLPRNLGGCGIPSSWIDWQSIAAAANICDEIVTLKNLSGSGYTTGKRYECHTVLPTTDSPLVNLETILSAMAGRKAFTGGKYKIVAGAFRPATLTITDRDIIGTEPLTASTYAGDDVPPNAVTATFADANNHWRETPPQQVRNQAYIGADGYEKSIDISLAATTDSRRAQYLMGVALEGSRPAMTITLTLGGIGEDLTIYDTAQFNITNRPQYAGRTFELIECDDNWDGTFTTTWCEIRTQTWALDPDKFTPTNPVVPGDNSYLFNPPNVQNFQVAAVTPQTLPDGTALMKVDLTWDPMPENGNTPSAHIDLRFRMAGGDWVGIASVPGDSVGTTITAALVDTEVYQFQARFVNGVGSASDWVDAWTQISGTPLPAPLTLRLRASSTIFRVPQTGNALPVSINLDAIRTTGLTNPATFTTNPPGITLGGSGDNRTLAFAAMGANESVQITCTVTQGSIDYVDVVTILKVYDGNDATNTPDPTTPPTPTGLNVQSFLVHLLVTWDMPVYTAGHGHAATIVYAAQAPVGNPLPTFGDAIAVGSSETAGFSFPAAPGTRWAIWIRHQSHDGYLSATAGGTNGMLGTTAQIGNSNLGPLVIEAGNLVDGAVTTPKLATGSINATKFASSIEPISIVSSVPAGFVTRTIFNTTDGNLYRWNGSTYIRTIASTDISGQLTNSQIAQLAAAKLTGQIVGTQITDGAISTPKLAAGAVTANEIAASAITAGKIAAGAITTGNLAAGAVTANELAANAVVAGKIAAGAIGAQQIQAGAITTQKLAVTGEGAALNPDPNGQDDSAWQIVDGTVQFNLPSSLSPTGIVIRMTNGGRPRTMPFRIAAGKRYRLTCTARQVSGGGPFYFRFLQYDNSGNNLAATIGVEAVSLSGTNTRFSAVVDAAPTATTAEIEMIGSYNSVGVVDAADIRCEEMIPGELIVDGAITARKLAIVGGGGALNDDPETTDITAWITQGGSAASIAAITDSPGITTVLRSAANVHSWPFSRPISFDPNKTYRVRARARNVGGNGTFYLTVDLRDASNQVIAGDGGYWLYNPAGITPPSSFTQYEARFGAGTSKPFPSNARTMAVGALLNYQGSTGYHEITDLLIEEAVDGSLIVDGAITATKIAANAIAVGTAAIQNGAIVNAMIANAAIDSAKILELTVSKLSGGNLGADIQVGVGRITFDNGVIMRVQGTGFGSANQFVDWFGPRTSGGNISLCTEANATYYLKTNGQAYFGGTLSAGVFKNAAQTTNSTATAFVEIGPFLTNGNPKNIVVSYQYASEYQFSNAPASGSLSGSGSATILLEKSTDGVNWTLIDTLNVSSSTINTQFQPTPDPDIYTFSMSGSHTVTDMQGATNNMRLRARLSARSLPTQSGTAIGVSESQFISVVSTE